MLNNLDLERILFLDIETVPEVYNYGDMDEAKQALWDHKSSYFQQRDGISAEEAYEKAGIFAEFGKIVCISVGLVAQQKGETIVKLKSFCDHDEKAVLKGFCDLVNSYYNSPQHMLAGHNAKEFDFPYIARRLLINGMRLPNKLDTAGKKPWEINHIDTMELWKFGDFKHFTSLNLLANIFKIPTPKDDISGADVARVYYEEEDLERIAVYCQKDVVTVIQLLLRFMGKPLIHDDYIIES